MHWKTLSLITYLLFDVVHSSNCYFEGYNLPCCNITPGKKYSLFSSGFHEIARDGDLDTYFENHDKEEYILMNALPKSLNITDSPVLFMSYDRLSEDNYLDYFKDFLNGRKDPSNPLLCIDRSSLCKYNYDHYGIRCCSGNPKVLYHDKYGDWGKEYNEWCLMIYDNNYSDFLPEDISDTVDFEDPIKECEEGYTLYLPLSSPSCGSVSREIPEIFDVDEIGIWGVTYTYINEKLNWCLKNPYWDGKYSYRKTIYNISNDKCLGITNGYPCCNNNFNVYYTDYLGDWSFEYNNWCLIYKDQEKYEYNKNNSTHSDDTVYEVGAINRFNNMKNPYSHYTEHVYGGIILDETYDSVNDEFMMNVVKQIGGYYGRPNVFYMDLKEMYDILDYEEVDCSFSFQIKKTNTTTTDIYVATNVNDRYMSFDDMKDLIRNVNNFLNVGNVFKIDVTNEYQTFTFNKKCNSGVYLLLDDQINGNTVYLKDVQFKSTRVYNCWSKAYGYPCCQNTQEVLVDDEYGTWGHENGNWCGIESHVKMNNHNNECWSIEYGYPCCNSKKVVSVDEKGSWGYEFGRYCGIVDDN